jgi:Putative Actinobacterial Holin-X, holin superfamily III
MVAQATMNGNKPPSAAAGATRNASAVLGEVVALAELQALLLGEDYRESKRRLATAAVALLVGVALLWAALPVALIALAAVLSDAGLSAAAAYGIAALAAVLVAGTALWWGWRRLHSALGVFARSRDELNRNLAAVRDLLGSRERD